jgi:hypothetical protein
VITAVETSPNLAIAQSRISMRKAWQGSRKMKITDVVWVQDRLGHQALDLRLDGHPAHFKSSQWSLLLARGIVAGVAYFKSEPPDLTRNVYLQGSYGPTISPAQLVGCTDDPGVYALFTEMSEAIRAGTWGAGPRS